jgi:hypothetical protein
VRCSYQSSTRSVRWPFAVVDVDEQGLVVTGRKGELASVRWADVERVVRCGFVLRDNLRVVPADGSRFVVGGPKVVALVTQHLPAPLTLRTERRRWFPWIPKDAAQGFTDRRPGSGPAWRTQSIRPIR